MMLPFGRQKKRARQLERCVQADAKRAWRIAYAIVRDVHEAEDAVQQACLVAARKLDQVPLDDPWPWFRTVVVGEARNARRRLAKHQQHLPIGQSSSDSTSQEGSHVQPRDHNTPTPDSSALGKEEAKELWEALDCLPEDEREAILLTHFEGMTHAEAAEALGRPATTLSSQVSRGMERLRTKLKTNEKQVAYSIAALPLAEPAGGLAKAAAGWLSATEAAITASVGAAAGTTATATGVTLMASKSTAGILMVGALAAGVFGGVVVNESMQPEPEPVVEKPDHSAELKSLKQENESLRDDKAHFEESLTKIQEEQKKLKDQLAGFEEAAANDTSAELIASLTKERDGFRNQVEELKAKQPAAKPALPGHDIPVAFGDFNDMPELRNANWPDLAKAVLELNDLLPEFWKAQLSGEPDPNLTQKLTKTNSKLIGYAASLTDKLDSSVSNMNGEFTHPVVTISLIAAALIEKGNPFSEEQMELVVKAGDLYLTEMELRQSAYSDATTTLMKVHDELDLKVKTSQRVYTIMSDSQRKLLYNKEYKGIIQQDIFSPVIMLAATGQPKGATTPEALLEDLKTAYRQTWGLNEAEMARVDSLFAQHFQSGLSQLTAVPSSSSYFYTEADALSAMEAACKLQVDVLNRIDPDSAAVETIKASEVVYIPRLVKVAEAPAEGG